MDTTEKVSLNMNVVDLGKIDLLVEEGFYANRSDFIRAAVRTQLNTHAVAMDQITARKAFALGVMELDADYLRRKIETGEVVDVKVIGILILTDDITPDLALTAFGSVTVRGSLRAPAEVKAALAEAGRLK